MISNSVSESDHLRFLRNINDYEKQRDYVNLIFRIAEVELENPDKDGWRASWPFPPDHHQRPWIPAKTGYLNKLENEGLIKREKLSNSRSIYRLDVDVDELVTELDDYIELLDEDNPIRDLEFS